MAKSDCIIFLNPENFHLIFRDRKLIAAKRRMTILLQKLKSHGMEKPFKAMTISIVTHSRLHPNFQNIGVRFRIAWEPKRHSNAPHSDRFTKNCAPDCCDLMCVSTRKVIAYVYTDSCTIISYTRISIPRPLHILVNCVKDHSIVQLFQPNQIQLIFPHFLQWKIPGSQSPAAVLQHSCSRHFPARNA